MDLARIGHIGAEVAVVGGVAFLLMQQNKTLQAKVGELEKKLQHVALHTRNVHQEHENRITSLTIAIEKLSKPQVRERERPVRARDVLRASVIDDDSPSPAPTRHRKHRLPAQEPSSPLPLPLATAHTPPSPGEDDEESDPEAVLKRE